MINLAIFLEQKTQAQHCAPWRACLAKIRIEKKILRVLLFPVTRFWMMFLVVAVFQLLFTYGTRIGGIPFLTVDGVHAMIVQWMRLWLWLSAVSVFRHTAFNNLLYKFLAKAFRNERATLWAGLLASEYFPAVMAEVQREWKPIVRLLVSHPEKAFVHLSLAVERAMANGS